MRNTILLFIIVCITLILNANLFAQDSLNVERVREADTHWWGSHINAIAVQDDYAYFAARYGITGLEEGSGMSIFNVSDPESPEYVQHIEFPGNAKDIVVEGEYAYLAETIYDRNNPATIILRVIDISNPAIPVETGMLTTEGYAFSIFLLNDIVYMVGGNLVEINDGLRTIDVSDPQNPVEAGAWTGEILNADDMDICVSDDYANVAAGDLFVLDVSDPENPDLVIRDQGEDWDIKRVFVSGEFLYAADRDSLRIFDISDPENPDEISVFEPARSSTIESIFVDGNFLYVGTASRGLHRYNVSDPENPEAAGAYSIPGPEGYYTNFSNILVSGDYAFTSGEISLGMVGDVPHNLHILDISDPDDITRIGGEGRISAVDVSISGNFAYTATEAAGLLVFDISDPEAPAEVVSWDIVNYWDPFLGQGTARCVTVDSDYAYMAIGDTLFVINVSDPENPELAGSCASENDHYDNYGSVLIDGDYAYVGPDIFDISNPEDPELIGYCESPSRVKDVFVSGDYAYIAAHSLLVFDISDPENPVEVGTYNGPGSENSIFVVDTVAYVAGGRGLRLIDVSNPEELNEIGFYFILGSAIDVFVLGGLAYVSYEDDGIRIIDVSDPENPVEVGFYDTPGIARNVALSEDGFIYVADETNLGIYHYAPEEPSLYVTPHSLDFDSVMVDSSTVLSIMIRNWGRDTLIVSDIEVESDQYSVDFEDEFILEPDSSIDVFVTFSPDTNGFFEGALTVSSNDPLHEEFVVDLHGIGYGYDGITSESSNFLPDKYSISTVYPNPFNPVTTVVVGLPEKSHLNIRVFNLLGQQVAELADGRYSPGYKQFIFDASDYASGIYIIHAEVPGKMNEVRKIVLMR
ncbi:MAG: T9SS type A sorting domain-containing protein [Candidatus Electryonea clarkiae]|nr:T9SS type A sorting domain-containing protein [Candidatus Electryonea clarkiae]MDP8289113.1 T9SS type A sorting domain-containing protein [Candidatus Electryonea clarkiae]